MTHTERGTPLLRLLGDAARRPRDRRRHVHRHRWLPLVATIAAIAGACSPPPPPGGGGGTPDFPPGCYGGIQDIGYAGPIDTQDNATVHDSTDGTCSGAVLGHLTVVHGTDLSAAAAECQTIYSDPAATAYELATMGFTVPPDFWFCSSTPVTPITVEAGLDFSCSIMSNETVSCWGANDSGQLGNGTTTDSPNPVTVAGLSDVSSLALGSSHACAETGGELWCWGSNTDGQLGDGTTVHRTTPVQIPVPPGAPSTAWTTVDAGFGNTCAWTSGSVPSAEYPELYCWGRNTNGALGSPHEARPSPTLVHTGQHFESSLHVGIGIASICVIEMTHLPVQGSSPPSVQYCGGDNTVGQFGNSFPTGCCYKPFQLVQTLIDPGWPDYRDLDGGGSHFCMENLTDDQIGCWGGASSGELGNGSFTGSPTMVTVAGTWRSLSSGWTSSCAHETSAEVYACWGRNQYGQLGDGTTVNRASPVVVPLPVADSPHFSQANIAAGETHSCALTPAGNGRADVYCWGSNGLNSIHGVLGTTGITQSSTPLRIPFD
jgi:alpha-tubulin suppressor-like RCC1 family protein